ncbi:MAG: hypothetical protein H0U59_12450 [Gemmatimonadaceae bacterium]|nr:hypothetical protein [Gemmatimonadaceae bacterium]
MRAYTVATAAITLRVPAKWVDNTLSHHSIPGVLHKRQGVRRRLTPPAIVTLCIALLLTTELSLSLAKAVEISAHLVHTGGESAEWRFSENGWLRLNVVSIEKAVIDRLAQAVEVTPIPRRGRPPK